MPLHIDGQRFERRDVQNATTFLRRGIPQHQLIQTRQKRRQRFARSRRRKDQRGLAARNRRPALALRRRHIFKYRAEPRGRNRMKQRQHVRSGIRSSLHRRILLSYCQLTLRLPDVSTDWMQPAYLPLLSKLVSSFMRSPGANLKVHAAPLAFAFAKVYAKRLTMSQTAQIETVSPEQRSQLRSLAEAAAQHSYSPYSHFRVGAALLLEDGSIVTGCNVENCSYRLTSCAEQGAIARAVAERGPGIRLRAVAVANLNGSASMPCGACRQALTEFGDDQTLILYPGENGAPEETTLGELLPHAFRLEYLS